MHDQFFRNNIGVVGGGGLTRKPPP